MPLRLLLLLVLTHVVALEAVTYDIAPAEVGSGFARPVGVFAAPGVNNLLFVIEQHTGRIRILNPATQTVAATPFLTVTGLATGDEQGLLGLTFHPQYASNGRLYVNCTRGSQTQILRFVANGSPTTPTTAGTETTVLTFSQPATNHNGGWLGFGPDGYLYIATGDGGSGNGSPTTPTTAGTETTVLTFSQPDANHNGGWLGFGPDGNLYIATGDGGSGNDPYGHFGNAQNRANLLGKILRINVDGGTPYAIPAGNPYASTTDGFSDEIWCWGLRNPWRCSFDRNTGDLWIGDVGQVNREEVNVCPSGQKDLNFGWRVWEGIHRNFAGENLQAGTHSVPVVDYGRGLGTTVIGGYVYRGSALSGLTGTYFYADYGSRRVWALRYNTATATRDGPDEITNLLNPGNTVGAISSFGEDNAGELYLCTLGGGKVYRIVQASPVISTASPLPASTINRPYSRTFAASGGTTPYTWDVSTGTLPAGISMSSAGVLAGTPSASGAFSFTVRVTPASGPAGTQAVSLVINPALAITTTTLPNATITSAYNQTLATSGGTGAKTFAVTAGGLPTGLSLSSGGVISGTPSAVQTASFTITATDTVGATATRGLSITVSAAPVSPVISTTSPLPASTINRPYSLTFAASGGTTPYTWDVSTGTLPAGISMSSAGVLAGTPSASGAFSFTVRVTPASGPAGTQAVSLVINPALAITTTTLPNATITSAYNQTLATSGGTGVKAFAVTAGGLPTGLSLSSGGVISGTPSAVQTASFTITATDTVGATATRALSITVSAAPLAPTFTSTAPLRVRVNSVYTYDANASGNPAPTFSLLSPPAGMGMNTNTGVITWTPTTVGNQSVSVRASNGVLPNATQTFVIAVHDHGLNARPAATPYLNMPTTGAGAKPALLSQTGTFANTATMTPSSAMIPYGVNAPFWADGALKTRWVAIPDGSTIGYAATGAWTFPAGTVLVKHFGVDLDEGAVTNLRRLETRVLVVQDDGYVYGTTYRWNGSDAERVDSPQTETVTFTPASGGSRNQTWLYPGPADCLQCHTPNSNRVLGVNARQLNGAYAYAAGSDNQLRTWSSIGLFNTTLGNGTIAGTAKLSGLGDSGASLQERVRSYLDANCANCHLPGGAPATFDARYETPLNNQGLINGSVYNALGISGARVVVPGDVSTSILHARVHSTDNAVRMPPIGRYTRDEVAAQTIADWIDQLPPDTGSGGGGGSGGGSSGGGCGLGSGLGIFAAILLFMRLRLRARQT